MFPSSSQEEVLRCRRPAGHAFRHYVRERPEEGVVGENFPRDFQAVDWGAPRSEEGEEQGGDHRFFG